MKKSTVIIPVYKNTLNENETMAFEKVCNTLCNYPITIICAEDFAVEKYLKLCPQILIERFDSHYFSGINGYNKLLLSYQFYKRFEKYRYMLIYQLDAYIFKDEFQYWCNQGFDYIGAPWTGFKSYKNNPLTGVGNGGFSLRNVQKSMKLLRKLRFFEVLYSYRNMNNKYVIISLPVIIKKLNKAIKYESKFEKEYVYSEDIFWCKGIKERLNSADINSLIIKKIVKLFMRYDFKIAPIEIASRFSIELNPRHFYEINSRKLPFGCHAWEKYDPVFWQEFIPLKPTNLSASK